MIQELRLVDNVCMLIQEFPQEQWARIPTPYSIKDKDARLWDTTKCDGSYTWYLHFTCITYWLQSGFESILVSIFDHLIDITFRIVYQQAHCHWSSLLVLCSVPIDRSFQMLCLPSLGYRDLAWICSSYLWIDGSKLHTMSWWHPCRAKRQVPYILPENF